jgi:hypothetical protein
MLIHFVENEDLSPSEIQELRERLDQISALPSAKSKAGKSARQIRAESKSDRRKK